MKKTILIIGILIFSLNCESQNQEATLYLRNGDTITGLAKITNFGKIKFKLNKHSSAETYDEKTLIKLDIKEEFKYRPVTYFYKIVYDKKKYSKTRLMKLVTEGKINLYTINSTVNSAPIPTGFAGAGMVMSNSFENYFVCRDNSDIVSNITTLGDVFDKNFIKAASEYFSDCPVLVNKIENKDFKKNDIEDIVKFYNKECM